MNSKKALFFVGKCLSLSQSNSNLESIQSQINNKQVDWDKIVQVSTEHLVFPALYLNLKRNELLAFLPSDLVAYMNRIYTLNKERNIQIVEQARELNLFLLSKDIQPIFLKGSSLLLQKTFKDVGERMVGDIDFLVSHKDYQKTIKALYSFGYKKVRQTERDFPGPKHYPRLNKDGRIAAVEIHFEMLKPPYNKEFNFVSIQPNILFKEGIRYLGLQDQLSLAIMAKEINDDGQYYKNMGLRNGYDLIALAPHTNALEAASRFNKLFVPLNNFIASTSLVFSLSDLKYKATNETRNYMHEFRKLLSSSDYKEKAYRKVKAKLLVKSYMKLFVNMLFSKTHRKWIFYRVQQKDWQQKKLIQLGLKSRS